MCVHVFSFIYHYHRVYNISRVIAIVDSPTVAAVNIYATIRAHLINKKESPSIFLRSFFTIEPSSPTCSSSSSSSITRSKSPSTSFDLIPPRHPGKLSVVSGPFSDNIMGWFTQNEIRMRSADRILLSTFFFSVTHSLKNTLPPSQFHCLSHCVAWQHYQTFDSFLTVTITTDLNRPAGHRLDAVARRCSYLTPRSVHVSTYPLGIQQHYM